MSLDYLKRLLDRNGIDGWSLQTLATTDRGDVLWMSSTGGQKAAELWRRLRGVAPKTGHWPVILGDAAHAQSAMRDQLSSAVPVSEVLRAATAIDGLALLRERRDERLEDLSENNEGADAEEFEPPLAEFPHHAHDLLGRNLVIPDWISRDVLRRERLRDYPILPR